MTIQALEEFFTNQDLPREAQLNRSTRIVDVALFLEAQFLQVKLIGLNCPAHLRLMQFKEWLLEGGVDYVKDVPGA